MTFRSWREAVEALASATSQATSMQHRIADLAGVNIPANTPRLVAAAALRNALAGDLGVPLPRPLTDEIRERLENLRRPSETTPSPTNDKEAEAWIEHLRLVGRRDALERLQLQEGDVVTTHTGEVATVASVGHSGRVMFKGGMGRGAWPDLISVAARAGDTSAAAVEIRKQAQKLANRRRAMAGWSAIRQHDLRRFATPDLISEDEIAELENIIDGAGDERPIQKYLEAHPHLLTALLSGRERYCLPQKQLGAEFVSDFIIGDVNSMGVNWVLVELETPKSGIYLKSGDELDAKARGGKGQIIAWRNWLAENLDYARRLRAKHGLGLADIREKTDGLVLVGRRQLIPETHDAQRHELRQSSRIDVHSYDWLTETLWSAARFDGPPALNPSLLQRDEGD